MTERDKSINSAEEALLTVRKAEATALKATMPPTWFGIALSIIVGSIVAINGAGYYIQTLFIVPFIPAIMFIQYNKVGATPQSTPTSKIGYFIFFFILLFIFFLTAIIRYSTYKFGMTWTPLMGGCFVGILMYLLHIYERRSIQRTIKKAAFDG
jgi:hypothetical protein